MKKILILFVALGLFLSSYLAAIEMGKWNFVVDDNYCYIASASIQKEGDYTKRGDTYVLVYRINKSLDKIVQVTAGYNYDESKPVIVKIDQTTFDFFGKFFKFFTLQNPAYLTTRICLLHMKAI